MKTKKHLIDGPISSQFIAREMDEQESQKPLGAHALFVGTVRADQVDQNTVTAITYSAYEEMIAQTIEEIINQLTSRYDDLGSVHIYHSIGRVKVNEHSLYVRVSSGHRRQAFQALAECVELIKKQLPVWKKEEYDNGTSRWLKA